VGHGGRGDGQKQEVRCEVPVVARGRTYDVASGGLETTVEAPLGYPPLFLRVDAAEFGELREAFAAPA
jgi:hypothetical protein